MFEPSSHPRVAVAALVALAALSGAVAAAPDAVVASPAETDRSTASADRADAINATILYEGDRLVVRAAENQTVRVRTDADPGTEITVEARAGGEFIKTRNVVVSENGTATATFDFSDVAAGTEFTASVRKADDSYVDGVLVNDTASIDAEEPLTVAPGANLTVRGETTADPGTELVLVARSTEGTPFLKTEGVTVQEDGTFSATFGFAGVESGAEFEVAVRTNATLKSGPVEGEVVAETTTTDGGDAAFTTDATTDTPTTTTATAELDAPGVPGFGAPVALVALLAAVALATRR